MRIALVSAFLAGCLVMPAHAASLSETVSSSEPSSTRAQMAGDDDFRLHHTARIATVGAREAFETAHHMRFEHHLLEYFPIADSRLHLSFGMQKDKRLAGNRLFSLRGVPMFSSTATGVKRKVSPGFAVGYDEPIARHDTLNFDIGMRTDRDALGSQLSHLVGADERQELGVHSSRFGPAAHLTFIHSF